MDYETTGALMGMGDRIRRERAHAQAVVDQVVAQRDRAIEVANHNLSELNKANAYIEQLERIIRSQAAGRA